MLGVVVVKWGAKVPLSDLPGGTAWSEANDGSRPVFVKCGWFPQDSAQPPPAGMCYCVQLDQFSSAAVSVQFEASDVYPAQVLYGTRPI